MRLSISRRIAFSVRFPQVSACDFRSGQISWRKYTSCIFVPFMLYYTQTEDKSKRML